MTFFKLTACLQHVLSSVLLVLLLPIYAWAQTAPVSTATQVFEDAKQYGKSTTTGTKAGINTTQGTSIVPYYGGAAPQGQLFGNGQGITSGAGTQRMAACATNPNTGSAFNQQECEAVNFMAQSPTTRPQFAVTRNDPVLTAGATAISNAPAVVGNGTVGGTYSACTTTNQTTAAEYRTEVCHNFATAEDNTCPITRDIVVDAKYNYRCDKSPNSLSVQSCNRTLTVSCQADQSSLCQNGGIVIGTAQPANMTPSIVSQSSGASFFNIQSHVPLYAFTPGYSGLSRTVVTFNVPDISKINTFKLLSVNLTTHHVYIVLNGYDFPPYSWSLQPPTSLPHILTNLLAQGLNTLEILVEPNGNIAANGVLGNIVFQANSACQPTCTETWNNGCAALEARQ